MGGWGGWGGGSPPAGRAKALWALPVGMQASWGSEPEQKGWCRAALWAQSPSPCARGLSQASGQQPAVPWLLLLCSDLAGLVCLVSQACPLRGQVGRWELCFLAGSHPVTSCKPKKLAPEREDVASPTAWALARGSAGFRVPGGAMA